MLLTHLLHLLLAAALAAAFAAVLLLSDGRTGVPIRVGSGGRIRTVVLARRRPPHRPAWLQDLLRLVLGDVRGPVDPALYAARVERAGLPGLHWRLLHAGLGHRSVAWFRLQQAQATVAGLLGVGAVLLSLNLPLAPSGLLLLPAALLAGYALPLMQLTQRAAARRERLRVELVGLLYGLAAFVAAGRPLDRALDRLAQRPGELAHELFQARDLSFRGLSMAEALGVLAARCDTAEVRDALSLILAARDDAVDKRRIPRMLAALAETTRLGIRERRKVQVAYALLRTTALGTLLGLPVIGTALLFPVLSHALHVLH
jgi:hypothetical protein